MLLLNVLGCKTSNKILIIKLDMKVHVAQLAVAKLSSFIDKNSSMNTLIYMKNYPSSFSSSFAYNME